MNLEAVKIPQTKIRFVSVREKEDKIVDWNPDDYIGDDLEDNLQEVEEDEKERCHSGKYWLCAYCKHYEPICKRFEPIER